MKKTTLTLKSRFHWFDSLQSVTSQNKSIQEWITKHCKQEASGTVHRNIDLLKHNKSLLSISRAKILLECWLKWINNTSKNKQSRWFARILFYCQMHIYIIQRKTSHIIDLLLQQIRLSNNMFTIRTKNVWRPHKDTCLIFFENVVLSIQQGRKQRAAGSDHVKCAALIFSIQGFVMCFPFEIHKTCWWKKRGGKQRWKQHIDMTVIDCVFADVDTRQHSKKVFNLYINKHNLV